MSQTHSQVTDLIDDLISIPIKKTVVIGAGIGGLTTAIRVLSEKKKEIIHEVTIIERLPENLSAIRPQLIMLHSQAREYLETLQPSELTKEDKQFLATFDDKREHVAIKDIQRYLTRRLAEQKNGKCIFLYDSAVSEINTEKSTLTIETGKDLTKKITTIDFNCLVLAEGTQRSTAKKLAESGHPIEFKTLFTSHQKYMTSGYFSLKRKDEKPFEIQSATVLPVSAFYKETLPAVGCMYYNRSSHIKKNKTAVKFYIAVAIPLNFYEEFKKNSSMGIKFLKSRAEDICNDFFKDIEYEVTPVKPSKKLDGVGAVKDKLKYQVFPRDFIKAKSAGMMIAKSSILCVGDFFKNPNFYLANGGNDANSQGIKAGDFILENITLEEFNQFSEDLVEKHITNSEEIEQAISQFDDDILLPDELNPKKKEATPLEIEKYIETSINLLADHQSSLEKKRSTKIPKSISYEKLAGDIQQTTCYQYFFKKCKNNIPQLKEAFGQLKSPILSQETEELLKKINDETCDLATRTIDSRKKYLKK